MMWVTTYLTAVRFTTTLTQSQLQTQISHAAQLLDKELRDLQQISFRITEDPTFRAGLLAAGVVEARQVIEELRRYQTTNNLVGEIFYIPSNHPYVYTSRTSVRRNSIKEQLVVFESTDALSLVSADRPLAGPVVLPEQRADWRDSGMPGRILLLGYPVNLESRLRMGKVVFAIRAEAVSDLIRQAVADLPVGTFILDESGDLLLFQGNELAGQVGRASVAAVAKGGSASVTVDGDRYVFAEHPVPSIRARIAALTPEAELLRSVRRVQVVLVVLVVAVLLLGIALARRFARETYLPVRELVQLASHNDTSPSMVADEWSIIRSSLARTPRPSDGPATFVQHVLHGEIATRLELDRMAESEGVLVRGAYLRVAIALIDPPAGRSDLASVMAAEMPAVITGAGMTELSEYSAVFILAADCAELDDVAIDEWRARIKARVRSLVTIGVGGATTDPSALSKSLSQARNSLEYRFLLGEDRIIQSGDAQASHWDPNWYPSTEMRELQLSLSAGDVERTRQLFTRIIATVRGKAVPIPEVRGLSFDIVRLVRQTFARYRTMRIGGAHDVADVDAFLTIRSIDQLALILERVAEETALVIEDRRNAAIRRFHDEARSLIASLITDASFSAELVAERLDMSVSYFSRQFRKAFGEPFQDYVIRIRMERAQNLLADGNLAVSEVAGAVGYSDVSGFIRRFKSFCGVTPARYRESV